MNPFLTEVLSKIPEESRANVEALLTENPAVTEALGGYVNAQKSDYSKNLDRVREVEVKQKTWWEENHPLVELGQKAKSAGFDPGKPIAPSALPDDVVRRADLEQREGLILPLIGTLSGLAVQHFAEFGEPLDVMGMINNPAAVQKGIPAFYAESVATRRAEKAKAAEDARISKAVEEGIAQRLKTMGNPSYPGPLGEDYSPLAALPAAKKDAADTDEMVDLYNQLAANTAR